MTKINEIELKRVNLNLPVHIINKVNEYAHNLGINNTSAYIVLLNQALEQKQTLNELPKFISAISRIVEFVPNNSLPLIDNDNSDK